MNPIKPPFANSLHYQKGVKALPGMTAPPVRFIPPPVNFDPPFIPISPRSIKVFTHIQQVSDPRFVSNPGAAQGSRCRHFLCYFPQAKEYRERRY